MRPSNLNEWMVELASAIEDRDEVKMDELESISNDWLQDDKSLQAQLRLLEVARAIL